MTFDEIHGLADLKSHLRNSVAKNKVAHAQMFVGKPGSANLAMALAYATYVNSVQYEAPSEGLFGEAELAQPAINQNGKLNKVYKGFEKLTHPDLHFVVPTSTTSSITKTKDAVSENFQETFRQFAQVMPYGAITDWSTYIGAENKQAIIRKEESRFITKTIGLRNYEAPYKTVIIWLPELMQAPAANALLKLLEEPNGKTLFLLVSCARDQIISTILSRVQIVDVPEVSTDNIRNFLATQEIDQTRVERAAIRSEGNFGAALELAQHDEGDFDQLLMDWLRDCYRNDLVAVRAKTQQMAQLGKAQQFAYLQFTLKTFEKILLSNYQDQQLEEADPLSGFITKFSKAVESKSAILIIEELNKVIYALERNANARMAFLVISLNISTIFLKQKNK